MPMYEYRCEDCSARNTMQIGDYFYDSDWPGNPRQMHNVNCEPRG